MRKWIQIPAPKERAGVTELACDLWAGAYEGSTETGGSPGLAATSLALGSARDPVLCE